MGENNVYLALYRGRKTGKKLSALWENLQDGLIRFFTHGNYSHCEIAVQKLENWGGYDYRETFDCYTSSPRDGGVRMKTMALNREKWDLIPLHNVTEAQIKAYFDRTKGAKYDWLGVLGFVLFTRQNKRKFFCSEWCFNAIFGGEQGWRFSPNALGVLVRNATQLALN